MCEQWKPGPLSLPTLGPENESMTPPTESRFQEEGTQYITNINPGPFPHYTYQLHAGNSYGKRPDTFHVIHMIEAD